MSAPPRPQVEELDNVWIPLSDGCRLAARVWLPESAREHPVPAVLEYIPYRKRDFTAVRDASMHGFFASRGYAALRVDLRGSGESDGVLRDEYLPQELDDAREVLRWIAAQPWCSGGVGIIGLSWGGFNGLQIAALAPPELKAVISVCSSVDRYADDVHYMGGCLLTDNLSWASTMFAYNACPPDPEIVGDRWREMWLERLGGSGLWLEQWLTHQRRDAFWKHASVCEDYAAVRCPVFIVSGWADGYSNTVLRTLEHLQVPRKGLIGAWGHKYPQYGALGPAIGFLSEAVRWWDRWLKGVDTGIDDEPVLRVWMQDSVSPTATRRPGEWVAETEWPSPRIAERCFVLEPNRLVSGEEGAAPEEVLDVQSPLSVGLFAGKWMSYGTPADIPSDQREEDGGALIFDTDTLEEDLEILGQPRVELTLTSTRPQAMVAVRLSDVRPDGKATRVTFGLLNLSHRESHEEPEPLEPGREYRVTVPLNYAGQRFPAGNRLRISISSSYWPLAWPSPESARLGIVTGRSRLYLPVRPPRQGDESLRELPPRDEEPRLATTILEPAKKEWLVTHNLATNESALVVVNDDETRRIDAHGWEFGRSVRERYSYVDYSYDTVRGEVTTENRFRRGDFKARAVTRTVLTSSRTHFRVQATLDAYEGDARIFARSWDLRIPRDHL